MATPSSPVTATTCSRTRLWPGHLLGSLAEEAATAIDEAMARTAWDHALRDGYVSQQVYILMFLVLDSRAFREILLIKDRPRVEPWHQQVAALIATVMHEHGMRRHALASWRSAARPGTLSCGAGRDWYGDGAVLCEAGRGGATRRLTTRGGVRLPHKGDQPPRATGIGRIFVAEAGLQHRFFDRHPAGEADQRAEDGHEETQPAPNASQCPPASTGSRRRTGGEAADRGRW